MPCQGEGERLSDLSIGEQGHISDAVLEGTIINQGLVSNATMTSQAILSGGQVSGLITNEGRMENFEFSGTMVTGGTLIGMITNTQGGVLKDVHLGANTHISGGKLAGHITGDDNARLENIEVEAGSDLSGILIGDNVQLPDDIRLGKGVRFASYSLIPKHLELIALLPALPNSLNCAETVIGPERVDLSTDIVQPSEGILTAINALPYLKDNDWEISQNTRYGYLQLSLETIRFAVQPVSVKRATDTAYLQVQDDQSTRFITDTGLDILAQPAVQAPCELQTALAAFGLPDLIVQTNGNLKIPVSDKGNWFSARPDFASVEISSDKTPGLYFSNSPVLSGLKIATLVFTDQKGIRREQMIYPALAQALYTSAEKVVIAPYGVVSFQLAKQNYRGVVDYLITQSTFPTTGQMQVISNRDINGDGITDFILLYPNSELQTLFTLPSEDS
jgi:hypothetical protein